MMNSNEIFDYSIFINELYKYTELQRNSNQKVFKALQDTINAMDSASKLNQSEANLYLQILFTSLAASNINKRY